MPRPPAGDELDALLLARDAIAEDALDELFGAGMREVPIAKGAAREPADPLLRRVLEAAEGHDSVGDVAHAAGVGIPEARAALGRLELEGHLVRGDLGGWQRSMA
jgi:hypothetical protein